MVKKRFVDAIASTDSKTNYWKSSFVVGRMAYEEGNLKEAKRQLMRTLHRAADVPERNFAEGSTLMGLGAVCLAQGNFDEARKNLDRALAICRKEDTAPMRELLAVTLRFCADLAAELEEYSKAEEQLEESIRILEKLGIDASLSLAYSVCDLCGLYVMLQRLDEADELIGTAISIFGSIKGREDADYYEAMMIHQVAVSKSDDDKIEEIVEEALTKSAYQVSLRHPNLVRFLKRYVSYLSDRGETGKIDEIHERFNKSFR